MKTTQKGFTLIELMIVIAIIGILAAVAIPQYRIYTNRTEVSTKAVSAMRTMQLAISEYAVTNADLPDSFNDLTTVGFSKSDGTAYAATDLAGAGVTSIGIGANGVITVTLNFPTNTELNTKTLIITPTLNAATGSVTFAATGGTLDAKYRPKIQ